MNRMSEKEQYLREQAETRLGEASKERLLEVMGELLDRDTLYFLLTGQVKWNYLDELELDRLLKLAGVRS